MWVNESDARPPVDEGVKKRWEAAKVEKEDTELLIARDESTLGDLTHAMNEAVDDLTLLVEDYATLSLSGPFSAHLKKATRLLEQRHKDMEKRGISKEQLKKILDSLDLIKRKMELVTKAEEKAQKEM
jgi:hypothetical protein